MDAATFVKKIIVDKLKAKHVVVGYNYRFGYMGKGTADDLHTLGEKYRFGITIIPPIKSGRMIVSSSLIRQKIAEGDLDAAYNLLGRHFSITGFVQPGKRIGHKLGVPTANIHPKPYLILPPNGVYYTKTMLHGKLYSSITNMGVNPTVNYKNPDPTERIMETHILNFDQNIYNEYIEVFFIKKIRNEKKFGNTDALAAQLTKDIKQVEKYGDFEYNS
jgi:riboflavin kinase/FMN adenylyltransferase